MADNLQIRASKQIRTTDASGVHTFHALIDPTASTTPGASFIGEMTGIMARVSKEFTRENNATPYGIGDVVSAASTDLVPIEIPLVARENGGSGYIVGIRCITDVKSVTPRFRVHLFNAADATVAGDNLPHLELYAELSKRVGLIELPAMETGADATNSTMSRSMDMTVRFPFTCAAGTRSLWYIWETRDAVTLTALSKQTLVLVIDQN